MVQMPALNTPQFRWVKSRLAHKAQPVPPIFSPDVAARAVLYVSHHYRRELWVGLPTLKAIVANAIFPGLVDHILARTGFSSQQCDGPEDPNRPNNLWEPVESAHSTHGDFTARERPFSPQLWTNLHRGIAGLALLALAILGLGSWLGVREVKH
jgi:hypothetical protein